jgi:hypothetical protein
MVEKPGLGAASGGKRLRSQRLTAIDNVRQMFDR